jgi:hypothetical protein
VTIEDLIRKEGREPGGKSMARYRFVPEPGLVFKRYPEPSRAIKLSFDRSTHVTLGKARYVNVKVVTTGLPPTAGKIDAYLELDK